MRAGYKTTEFWLASLITVAGAIIAGAISMSSIANSEVLGKLGVIAAAITGAIYTIGRSVAKSGGDKNE